MATHSIRAQPANQKSPQKPRQVPPKDVLRDIAVLALIDVAGDVVAPAAARAAAARTILESLGDIGRLQELASRAEKPLSELSPQEIEAEIARLAEETRPAT